MQCASSSRAPRTTRMRCTLQAAREAGTRLCLQASKGPGGQAAETASSKLQ